MLPAADQRGEAERDLDQPFARVRETPLRRGLRYVEKVTGHACAFPALAAADRRGPGYIARTIVHLRERADLGDPVARDALRWMAEIRTARERCATGTCLPAGHHFRGCARGDVA